MAAIPNLGGTCTIGSITTGAGSITYASSTAIPPGGCTITVDVTSAVAGSYLNTIPANVLQTDGGNNRLPAVADLVVEAPIPPTVIKAFVPNVINPGGLSRLTITLGNSNAYPLALTGDLIDSLPALVTVAPVANVGGTCTLGSVTAAAGTGTIIYANGAVIPPGGCTIQVDVTAGVSGGPYTNTIGAGALQTDAGANTGPAEADLFVNPPQPPSVSKSISPSLIPKNGTAILTISLGNGNASPLTLTSQFNDTLPANLVVATPNGLAGNCTLGSVTAAEGSGVVSYAAGAVIPPGGCTIAVRVTSGTAGTYTNTIPAGALQTGAGANAVGTSASLQVVEWPTNTDLSLIKTIDPGTGSAGDLHTVTLKWRNTNAATPTRQMYQCSVSDPLPVGAFDPITVIEGTTPSGYTFNRNNNNVSYTRNDTTTPCETTEQTAIFTLRLKSDVITGSTYVNTATATAKTLPSNDPNVGNAGTLTRNASDDVTVGAAAVTGKSLEATSENFTDPGDSSRNANPPVAIGEVLYFRLAFTLPVGLTKNVILSDLLPAGLRHIGTPTLDRTSILTTSAGNPGGINSGTPGIPVNVSLSGTGGEITLALGDVANTAPGAQYILTLQAIVANVATNLAGVPLANQGRIYYDNAAGNQQIQTVGPVTVHVVTPGLHVAKNANPLTGAGGDTITYTLTVDNQSGADRAPAFEVVITDPLSADHELPVINCPGSGCQAGASGAALTAFFIGTTLTATVDRLDPGESVTFTYTTRLKASVTYGKSVVNTAVLTGTSLPGPNGNAAPGTPGTETGERTGEGGTNDIRSSSSSTVTINNPNSLIKTVIGLKSFYPIGDTTTYRLTLPVPVGTTTHFILTDTIPADLAYNSGSLAVTLPAGASAGQAPLADTNGSFFSLAGQNLTLDFGTLTVPTGGNITVDFSVTVQNVSATQDGRTFTNSATLTFDNPAGGTIVIGPATNNQVRVGEPNLELSKAITAGAVGADAGNTVSWQVILRNTGNTTAYRVDWRDVLPDGLNRLRNPVVVPNGGNVFLNGTTTVIGSGDALISSTMNVNDTLALPLFQIDPGASLTITWDSTVMDT
ncbi:MAG: isopeptide-forming domain-containing fimbrial protein, partial [Desulfobacteraceae bacterium]